MSESNFKSALEDYELATFVYKVFEEISSQQLRDYYYLAGYCRGIAMAIEQGELADELRFLHGWLLTRGLIEEGIA